MIKHIKKADVLKYLEDPKRDYVERHLREYLRHRKALEILIDELPKRKDFIVSLDPRFGVELEASAQAE